MEDDKLNIVEEMMAEYKKQPRSQVRNKIDIIELARKGLPKKSLYLLSDKTSLSIKDLSYALPVTERTIQRQDENTPFRQDVSERILEIAMLYGRGFEVFENESIFKEWMNSPNLALGGIKPKMLLDTHTGISLLLEEIGKIEHGVFA